MPMEVRRPCARAKRHLLVLLSNPQERDWIQACWYELDDILNDASAEEILCCSCDECTVGRTRLTPEWSPEARPVWLEKIRKSKRLLAVCVVADRPYLMYPLLRHEFDDSRFNVCYQETDLTDAQISIDNAKLLLRLKETFFDGGRVNLYQHLRSTRARDRPSNLERNWLINEMLDLIEKLALLPGSYARKLPKSITIGEITIRDSPARPRDRAETVVVAYGDQRVSMQTLGYLILDLIWFITGGGQCVLDLDHHRVPGDEWVKEIVWKGLESGSQYPELLKAFEFVWIMICPNDEYGLSKDERGRDNYAYVSRHFGIIWSSNTTTQLNGYDTEIASGITSLSSQQGPARLPYEEIEPELFRWMRVRCGTENTIPKRCRLGVYKSKDNAAIRIDRYNFDYDAINPSSLSSPAKCLEFVPLYAYGYDTRPMQFSAKFQLKPDSRMNLTIPHIFTFQNIDDVKTFQAALTSRKIEKDMLLNRISLQIKTRPHPRRLWGERWEPLVSDAGRVQLWNIVDRKTLRNIHSESAQAVRGKKRYPLRLEIALLSDRNLFVVGVKSNLMLTNLPNSTLRIESVDTTRAGNLEWKKVPIHSDTSNAPGGSVYPGLPLFQQSPFESFPGADTVDCQSLELTFTSEALRDDLKQYLEKWYNYPKVR